MAVDKKIVFSSEFKDRTQGFNELKSNLDQINKKPSFTQKGLGSWAAG